MRDHELALLRMLFTKWSELHNFGIEASVVNLLKHWRLKAAPKGDAINRLHPSEGPFSAGEIQRLLETVSQGYERGLVSINQASMLMLLQASGSHRSQFTSLKLKDLIKVPSGDGFFRFYVNVPRTKQRGRGFRQSIRAVEVIEKLWDVLQLQRDSVISRIAEQLDSPIPEAVIQELPLYFAEGRLKIFPL